MKIVLKAVLSLLLISLTFLLCSFQDDQINIKEGKSVGNIFLGMKYDSLTQLYQTKWDTIKHRSFSYELRSNKHGISVWFKQNNPENGIFAITVFLKTFKGVTSKGLKVTPSTRIKDVQRTYGELKWEYPPFGASALYDSLGIYFTISPEIKHLNKKTPKRSFNPKVISITIGVPDEDY
jgi:hypothetical protein